MPTQPRLHSPVLRRGSVGVAIGLALTLSVTGVGAAEAAGSTHHNPHGTFHVTLKGRHAHLWGTASDPDSSKAVTVQLIVAGRKPVSVTTNRKNHAYAGWVWLPYGVHHVAAKAVNRGAGASATLGRKAVNVRNMAKYNPKGTARENHSTKAVRFTGHVADRSAPHSSLTVRLWHNGKLVGSTHSNARSKAYTVRTALHNGANTFRLVAVNKGSGTHNTTIKRFTLYKGASWMARYHGNQHIAATLLPHYGWGASQMSALVQMWNRESHWNSRAANASGAYGIPQALPGSKMASAGSDWASNPRTQIKWGLGYIKSRYGSPINAWSTWQNQGSY